MEKEKEVGLTQAQEARSEDRELDRQILFLHEQGKVFIRYGKTSDDIPDNGKIWKLMTVEDGDIEIIEKLARVIRGENVDTPEEQRVRYSAFDVQQAIDGELGEVEIELEGARNRGDEWRERYKALRRDYEQLKQRASEDRSRWYHWRDKAFEKQRRIRRLWRENRALRHSRN